MEFVDVKETIQKISIKKKEKEHIDLELPSLAMGF